jgi:hypothetical protein
MKQPMKITTSIVALAAATTLFAFTVFDEEVQSCFIKVGETLVFSSKPVGPEGKVSMTMNRGAFDGSRYKLSIDTNNRVNLAGVRAARGDKPDELLLAGCTGILTRNKQGLNINLEKSRSKYYLINLDKGQLESEFEKIVSIAVRAETPAGKQAEFYCHQKDRSGVRYVSQSRHDGAQESQEAMEVSHRLEYSTIQLTAVPAEVRKEDIYAAKHPSNSIAHFTVIELALPDGSKKTYPSGSYALCEGDGFVME